MYSYTYILLYVAKQNFTRKPIANVKVSAGQDCVYDGHVAKKSTANERKEHNIEKYIQLLTTLNVVSN